MLSLAEQLPLRSVIEPPEFAQGFCPEPSPRRVTTGAILSFPEHNRYWLALTVPHPDNLLAQAMPNDGAIYSTLDVLAGVVCCDWLTLTTYDRADCAALATLWIPHVDQATRDGGRKVNQYAGWSFDGLFYGVADQNGRTHYMLQAWGSVAQHLLALALEQLPDVLARMKCTRIDVKLDGPTPTNQMRFGALYDLLIAPEYAAAWTCHNRGARPKLRTFVNEDGLDTLYIGSRKSDRMQRLYIKQVGDKRVTRWEVELKRSPAKLAWERVRADGLVALDQILAGEMHAIPLHAHLPALYALIGTGDKLRILRDKTNDERTLGWLYRSVLPAALRLNTNIPDYLATWLETMLQKGDIQLLAAE